MYKNNAQCVLIIFLTQTHPYLFLSRKLCVVQTTAISVYIPSDNKHNFNEFKKKKQTCADHECI